MVRVVPFLVVVSLLVVVGNDGVGDSLAERATSDGS